MVVNQKKPPSQEIRRKRQSTHTILFLTRFGSVSVIEGLQQGNARTQARGPNERPGTLRIRPEVSNAIDGTVVLTFPTVPVHTDPGTVITLHRPDILNGAYSTRFAGEMDSLPRLELAIDTLHLAPTADQPTPDGHELRESLKLRIFHFVHIN